MTTPAQQSTPSAGITPTVPKVLTLLPPAATAPPLAIATCTTLASNPIRYPGLAGQAWAADQIVVGTVVTKESRWETVQGQPTIFTYVLVRVDQRVRGYPEDELILRQYGGILEGCTQGPTDPYLYVGQSSLFFLRLTTVGMATATRPIYNIVGGPEGQRLVEYEGQVAWLTSLGSRMQLEQVLDELWRALAQPPPSTLYPPDIVPPDRAPVAPKPTPRH